MKRAFLLSFILMFAFGALDLFHAQAAGITAFCANFGVIHSAILTTPITPGQPINTADVRLTDAQIAGVEAWDAGHSIWNNPARQFVQPSDSRAAYLLIFQTDSGERQYEISVAASQPRYAYVYAYESTLAYSVAGGSGYGYHPCRAFRVPIADVIALTH